MDGNEDDVEAVYGRVQGEGVWIGFEKGLWLRFDDAGRWDVS